MEDKGLLAMKEKKLGIKKKIEKRKDKKLEKYFTLKNITKVRYF